MTRQTGLDTVEMAVITGEGIKESFDRCYSWCIDNGVNLHDEEDVDFFSEVSEVPTIYHNIDEMGNGYSTIFLPEETAKAFISVFMTENQYSEALRRMDTFEAYLG